jgi:hypothetical protein
MNKIFARILVFVIVMVAGLLVVNAWLGHHKITDRLDEGSSVGQSISQFH